MRRGKNGRKYIFFLRRKNHENSFCIIYEIDNSIYGLECLKSAATMVVVWHSGVCRSEYEGEVRGGGVCINRHQHQPTIIIVPFSQEKLSHSLLLCFMRCNGSSGNRYPSILMAGLVCIGSKLASLLEIIDENKTRNQ